ncbi:ABC transporter substrate-binding protein [Conexibacter sp. CPCC 206217]|uniref:ABC transporter substrate-binding protein n=1 Tax=Conexibacter sp. CPCC 206217 TaxID=3064574 RepID=UPI002715F4AD|nr:ABC transporter substrate-binding protein [Conexibacter sp. CPCC 206217]MDO8212134.1 ABC transporter substrate-binding protein [Conexibacter sp. CPCC 206217]
MSVRARRLAPLRALTLVCAALGAAALAAALLAAAPAARADDAERVVAFTPFTANIVAELGVEPVAIGRPPVERYLSSKLDGVPRIPLSHPNGANLEQLLALRPDLVLSSPTWEAGTPSIQRLGIKVYDQFDPQRIVDVPRSIRYIADVLDKQQEGAEVARRMADEIRSATRGIRARRSVLVVLGLSRYTVALLERTWGADVLMRAGATLATRGLKPLADQGAAQNAANISNEEVLRLDPDIIVVVPHGAAADIETIARYYRGYRPWRMTKAARSGRIYVPTDDQLLQATADPARTIREVRRTILRNWPAPTRTSRRRAQTRRARARAKRRAARRR